MLRVGLTGGMCCGKSTVAEMLRQRGAHVLLADRLAHELMQPGTVVYDEIVRRFGRDILDDKGQIVRARLATAAFARQSDGGTRIHELNDIIHPEVIRRQQEWMDDIGRREPKAIVVVEAALIFEAGSDTQFDKIVVVTCRPEQKAQRFAHRAGLDIAAAQREVESRSGAQLPDGVKVQRADYVIDNSGTLVETEKQVDKLFAELKRKAELSV